MIVGVIGSGGREHAICHALNKSKKIDKIYCFPGNAGTTELAENINLDLNNFENIKDFIFANINPFSCRKPVGLNNQRIFTLK